MLVGQCEVETVVRGSRFRAWLAAATDSGMAGEALARRAAANPDATHHCWAYRVLQNARIEETGFDAGEPGGTAGRPILGALQAARLVQTVCVVSRWFGGVKLGTGGLVRAYATAAGASIASAREAGAVLEARQQVRFQVRFPYPHSGAVQRAITRYDARSTGARYGELVELELRLPAESANGFERALADATAGSAVTRRGEVEWEPVG